MEQIVDQISPWLNELKLLGIAIVLGVVQLAWAAVEARKQQGLKWARGARDEAKPVTGVAARLDRAFRNYMESFPFFAAAVVAAIATDKTGYLTWWGALVFVAARIVYVPLYAMGVPGLRTLVWFIGFAGLISIVAALFM